METPNPKQEPTPEGPKKKPYHPPVFHLYGDIREITKTVGVTGRQDGAGKTAL